MHLEPQWVTTGCQIPGHRIVSSLGLAQGMSVCAPSAFGNLGAVLQSFVSGDLSALKERIERAQEEAYQLVLKTAEARGANAVIGLRYHTDEVAQCVTVVLAYGTAVVVEQARG
jgi:uncharacterized protein YbjQ (UPF0145 family)